MGASWAPSWSSWEPKLAPSSLQDGSWDTIFVTKSIFKKTSATLHGSTILTPRRASRRPKIDPRSPQDRSKTLFKSCCFSTSFCLRFLMRFGLHVGCLLGVILEPRVGATTGLGDPKTTQGDPRGHKSLKIPPKTSPEPSQMKPQTLPNQICKRFFALLFSYCKIVSFFPAFLVAFQELNI